MPSKVQIYAQLAEDTGRQIMKDYENWTAFLRTSARLYKYPYADQLMIYAQRPDATACASYDLWNNTMQRYVKRDSKGIALLRANGDNAYLTYVFDVTDTGTRRNSRPVVLMEMYPEHTGPVMSALEDRYGVSGDKSFEDQILNVSRLLAEEYWEAHNGEIFDIIEGSVLEGYDVLSIWVKKMQCECGKNFNRKGMSKTEDGQTECIYMCHGQVCTGTAAARAKKGLGTESICKVPIIPSWKLQMMAYEVFHACLQDVDTVLELAQGMLEKHINDRAERKGSPARETEIREEIDELKKRIDRCTELRIDNEISNELYKKKKQEYEIRISDLKSELDEIYGCEEEIVDENAPVADRIKTLVDRLRQEIVD